MTTISLVPIGNGRFVIVDPEDAGWVQLVAWKYKAHSERGTGYAERCKGKEARMMHVAIMQRHGLYVPGQFVDHRNCWGLDNRKCNLHMVSQGENIAGQERGIRHINDEWVVVFRGSQVGRFRTELEALVARSNAEAAVGHMTRLDRMRAKAELYDVLIDLVINRLITIDKPWAERIEDQYKSIARISLFQQMNAREARDLARDVRFRDGQWYAKGVPVESREEALIRVRGPFNTLTCERKHDLHVRNHDEQFALLPMPAPITLHARNGSGYTGVAIVYRDKDGMLRFGAKVRVNDRITQIYYNPDPLSCAWVRRLFIQWRGLWDNALQDLPDRRSRQQRVACVPVEYERRSAERRQGIEVLLAHKAFD